MALEGDSEVELLDVGEWRVELRVGCLEDVGGSPRRCDGAGRGAEVGGSRP
jgi:hypothetical protein